LSDPLTGCFNRRFFAEVVDRELERHRRHGQPLSLLFIDCDRLKDVNDTLGHSAGDEVLRLVAQIIRTHVRLADYVFRWGGDEFLVMLSCDEAQALEKAKDIQRAAASELRVRQLPKGVGLSFGCIAVPSDTRDLMPVIHKADERMYANKRRTP
jgi:diguanylate cyclase (GGDEF)-like protein